MSNSNYQQMITKREPEFIPQPAEDNITNPFDDPPLRMTMPGVMPTPQFRPYYIPRGGMQGSSMGTMSSGRIYPADQPLIFTSSNPGAPPIFPCGTCHKEIHENDQAIQCQSGCNFFYHRVCTDLTEDALSMINGEPCAEWVCDSCYMHKDVKLVKYKP